MIKWWVVQTEPDDGAGRLSQNSDTCPLQTGTTRIIAHMWLALPLPTLPHLIFPHFYFIFSRQYLPFSYFNSLLCLGLRLALELEDDLLHK